jgi:hypothetical protein
MLATSKFCLAPSGFGWGVRLMHYIIRGCVPVIVQVGRVWWRAVRTPRAHAAPCCTRWRHHRWPLSSMRRSLSLRRGARTNARPTPLALHAQDDIYQPYEDQLPYADFSVRLPRSSLPSIAELLSDIPDADYRRLRCGLARHWRAFVWDRSVGGTAVRGGGCGVLQCVRAAAAGARTGAPRQHPAGLLPDTASRAACCELPVWCRRRSTTTSFAA